MDETTAALILSHAPYFGPVTHQKLLSIYKTHLKVLENASSHPKLREETLTYIRNFENEDSWKQDLQQITNSHASLIASTDSRFPKKLVALSDCPPLLYYKGSLEPLERPTIAIIGTRASTAYGNEMASHFAKTLAEAGCTIVSGLARGIDSYAHKSALETGYTTAFIGSGLDCLYPKENLSLSLQIEKKGAVISELPMKEAPTKFTFPQRNRLVAACSDALLLIEAPQKSGAMITMNLGKNLGKPLFCISSRAGQENFLGNHTLLKQGFARLVDSPFEILETLNLTSKREDRSSLAQKMTSSNSTLFSEDEKKILAFLKVKEASVDDLSAHISHPSTPLQATLMKLVLKKIILELPGKRYTLVH